MWLNTTFLNLSEHVCDQVCFLFPRSVCKVSPGYSEVTHWNDPLVVMLKHTHKIRLHSEEWGWEAEVLTLMSSSHFAEKSNQVLWKASASLWSSLGYVRWLKEAKMVAELSQGSRHPAMVHFRNPYSPGAPSVSLAAPPPIFTPV